MLTENKSVLELAENLTKINLDLEDLTFESFIFLRHFEKTNSNLVTDFLKIDNYLDILTANTYASVILTVQSITLNETIEFELLCAKVFNIVYDKYLIDESKDLSRYKSLIVSLRQEIYSKVISQHKNFIKKVADKKLIESRKEVFSREYNV